MAMANSKTPYWEQFEKDTKPNATLFDDAGFLRRLASIPDTPFPAIIYVRRGFEELAALTWDQLPEESKPQPGEWRRFRETWRAFFKTGTFTTDYGMVYREQHLPLREIPAHAS